MRNLFRLKDLKSENVHLKKMVADQILDNTINFVKPSALSAPRHTTNLVHQNRGKSSN